MRILARAFLASYLVLFVSILSASLLAIGIIEVMLHFDDISARGGDLSAAVRWLAVRLPSYYLRDLIPVTSFAAAFLCLGLPARRRELTAIMAGGIPPLRVALPVLAAAAALSGVALAVDETLVLRASREWSRLEAAGGDGLFRRGSFWYHRGDVVYNVAAADHESRTLHDVELYELSPEGRLLRRIRAARVRVSADRRWHLQEATVVRFDPERPQAAPRVERVAETVLAPEDRDAPPRAYAASLSLPALGALVKQLSAAGRPTVRERAVLHARLAEPLTVAVFALLAVPLGVAVDRARGLSGCAVRGGVTLGAFYTARAVGSLLALGGVAWAAWSSWLLVGLFAALGIFQLSRIARWPGSRPA